MLIDGDATDETDARGRPVKGDTLLLLLNGGEHPVHFRLPTQETRGRWSELLDTADSSLHAVHAKEGVTVEPYSLVLLRYGRERRLAVEMGSHAELVGAEATR
jgi:glycogen operon protein